uniref:Uncharacterized protein n=1 Tax=Ditylenchus dipsaci TaxID=166011 RepID=A0A915DS18_9BILA
MLLPRLNHAAALPCSAAMRNRCPASTVSARQYLPLSQIQPRSLSAAYATLQRLVAQVGVNRCRSLASSKAVDQQRALAGKPTPANNRCQPAGRCRGGDDPFGQKAGKQRMDIAGSRHVHPH